MIHCIGNSHANMFTNSHPGKTFQSTYSQYFSSTSIGPVIAYNFLDHHLEKCKQSILNLNIKKNDKIMLIVGEVDCRWHLPKKINSNDEIMKSVVSDCVNRFFEAILSLQRDGYNMLTWGGHPSTNAGHNDNPNEPIWGDCRYRNKISLEWVDCMEKLSNKNNIPLISITKSMINDDGTTNMSYFNDYCHLNPQKALPIVMDILTIKGII